MFGLCPNLSSFWVNIFNAFSEMFGTRFDPNPVCALFGLTLVESRDSLLNKAYVVIAFTTLLARRLILLNWKQRTPSSFSKWIKDVLYFLQLEKKKYTLKGSEQAFVKVWRPLDFFDSLLEPLDAD